MEQEHQKPTLVDKFHAKWAVIAALLGALAGAGFQYISSRDVTDAKLLEMRGEIEKERGRADRLETQLKEFIGKAEESPSIQRGSTPLVAEPNGRVHPPMQVNAVNNGSSGGTFTKSRSVESTSQQPFETESYRLAVEDVKKSGKTVQITMVLEAIKGGLIFRAGGWYLLDENGERWSEPEWDFIRPRPQIETPLISGTKTKNSLVFHTTESGQGTNFTLIGIESEPQPRREIVLRGLVGNDG